MKEDIVEQLVEDFLRGQGYFTTHTVKFRPNQDEADSKMQIEKVRQEDNSPNIEKLCSPKL